MSKAELLSRYLSGEMDADELALEVARLEFSNSAAFFEVGPPWAEMDELPPDAVGLFSYTEGPAPVEITYQQAKEREPLFWGLIVIKDSFSDGNSSIMEMI